jgi:hypothetical protein
MDTTIHAAAIRVRRCLVLRGVFCSTVHAILPFRPFNGCVHCSVGLLLHPETLGYRAHQQIGEEANHQEPSHDLQDQGVGLLAGR